MQVLHTGTRKGGLPVSAGALLFLLAAFVAITFSHESARL